MIENLQNFVEGTDVVWQWLVIMLAGAIPFVESYFGSAIGVLAGVNPVIAIVAAIIGNIASMVLLVAFGGKIRKWRKVDDKPVGKRTEKIKALFNKYGIIGLSLFGQVFLPSQLTSMAMVSFGAPKKKVIFWQIIAIIIWGVAFGSLATAGANVMSK